MGMFDWLSPTAGADQGGMGLMGMLANPQTAGLLGMAGGLLQASGPSRLPVTNGQAMGAGLQNMQQGMGNALQMQRGLMTMRAMQGLMGSQDGAAPQPSGPQGAPVTGAPNTGPMSGPSAGMGLYAGAGAAPQAAQGTSAGPTIFGRTPQQLWQQGMMMNLAGIPGGADMMKMAAQYDPTLAAQMPTDVTKAGTQAGWTPQQIQAANADWITKNNALSIRPGGGVMVGNRFITMPGAAPAGYMNQQGADGSWSVVPIAGGNAAVAGSAAAKASGQAQYDLAPVWQQDPQTGQWVQVQQTRANVANAANGTLGAAGAATPASAAVVQTESGGNPNAVSPKGAQGAWQVMPNTQANPGFGVMPAQNNSRAELDRVGQDYYNAMVRRYAGNPTIGAIAYNMGPGATDAWLKNGGNWEALPQETRNYVGKVSTLTALNGGGAPQAGAPAPRSGPMLAAPPLGTAPAANAAQAAPSKQMADSYKGLSDSDASYQQSRGALMDMMAIAHQMGPTADMVSKLPENYHNWNSLVTQYDKAHATFVSNQYGALSAGTDASKGTVNDMVPGSDKPLDAQVNGLNTQLNNLDYRHLETQLMTPAFQAGDQKGYTSLNAAYHNIVKPEMMPVINTFLGLQSKGQLAAAMDYINKSYPQYKKAIDFLGTNGMFNGVGQ